MRAGGQAPRPLSGCLCHNSKPSLSHLTPSRTCDAPNPPRLLRPDAQAWRVMALCRRECRRSRPPVSQPLLPGGQRRGVSCVANLAQPGRVLFVHLPHVNRPTLSLNRIHTHGGGVLRATELHCIGRGPLRQQDPRRPAAGWTRGTSSAHALPAWYAVGRLGSVTAQQVVVGVPQHGLCAYIPFQAPACACTESSRSSVAAASALVSAGAAVAALACQAFSIGGRARPAPAALSVTEWGQSCCVQVWRNAIIANSVNSRADLCCPRVQ